MTHLFLMINAGNSGGSWFESVCNSHPLVHAWEEVTSRTLKIPKVTAETTVTEAVARQRKVFEFLKEQEASGQWQSIGLIKGFGYEVLAYCRERGGRVVQQFRHPIKVMYGTRKRPLQPYRWWGREPKDEREYFEGHARWMARRYSKFLRRADKYPLQTLEALSASLMGDRSYIRDRMEYITQVEWDDATIERIPSPRHRLGAVGDDRWREGYPCSADPSIEEIWALWTAWQRVVFLECFEDIMVRMEYSWPS